MGKNLNARADDREHILKAWETRLSRVTRIAIIRLGIQHKLELMTIVAISKNDQIYVLRHDTLGDNPQDEGGSTLCATLGAALEFPIHVFVSDWTQPKVFLQTMITAVDQIPQTLDGVTA